MNETRNSNAPPFPKENPVGSNSTTGEPGRGRGFGGLNLNPRSELARFRDYSPEERQPSDDKRSVVCGKDYKI